MAKNRNSGQYDLCPNSDQPETPEKRRHNGYVGLQPAYQPRKPKKYPNYWKWVVVFLVVSALFVLGFLIGFWVRHRKAELDETSEESDRGPCYKVPHAPKVDLRHMELLHENLMYSMSGDNMASLIRNYTGRSTNTGSRADFELAKIVEAYFSNFGFDNTKIKKFNTEYKPLLSFPNPVVPNTVTVRSKNGEVLHREPQSGAGGVPGTMGGAQGPIGGAPGTMGGAPNAMGGAGANIPESMKEAAAKMGGAANGMGGAQAGMGGAQAGMGGAGMGAMPTMENVQPFVAYSAAGTVQGEVVYVHHGSRSDFQAVMSHGVPMSGRIAVLRLTKHVSLAQAVSLAGEHGIVGALVYADPIDNLYSSECTSQPPYATLNDNGGGDPLTPGYPSIDGMLPDSGRAQFPSLPVQPISCQMAQSLLRNMSGQRAPREWTGALETTYFIGRKSQKPADWYVQITTHNQPILGFPVMNVIGTLTGYEEPDNYVIVGASRNSFGHGNRASLVGTGLLLEFGRALAFLVHREDWRPRRTIHLCSWGGAEFGNLGMVEFLEEYAETFTGRTVSYINLDDPVVGNYSLTATASSTIEDIIYNAAQRVPSPDEKQMMLYNTWESRALQLNEHHEPQVLPPVSEHTPFYSMAGATTVHFQYVGKKSPTLIENPMLSNQHTNMSVLQLESKHHYRHHSAVGRVAGLLALSFADAAVVQFDLIVAAQKLQHQVKELISIGPLQPGSNKTEEALVAASEELVKAAEAMHHFIMNRADFQYATTRAILNQRLLHCQKMIAWSESALSKLRDDLSLHQIMSSSPDKETSTDSTNLSIPKDTSLLLQRLKSASQALKIEL